MMDALAAATGFVLGLRHALEPDHVAAVAQFASADARARRGLAFGLAWGAGHGLTVLALGGAALVFGPRLSPALEPLAERAVGVLLVALAVWRLAVLVLREHEHPHRHRDGVVHSHPHAHRLGHVHAHGPALAGIVHGAAGIVGVLALLPSGSPAPALVAFAVGGCVAMGALGLAAGRLYGAAARWRRTAAAATACSGLALGVLWIVRSFAA